MNCVIGVKIMKGKYAWLIGKILLNHVNIFRNTNYLSY
jgi:hypothetical protein